MPRFSRSNIRPVNRIKHVVDVQGATTAGTTFTSVLADTKDAPVITTANEVQTGCTINGIYLTVEVNATTSAALANVYMILYKNPAGEVAGIVPNTVGVNVIKKFVFHQEMVMLQQVTNSNPRTLFKGVLALPKHMRRFGPADTLVLRILAPGVNINLCIQCIYKEFR